MISKDEFSGLQMLDDCLSVTLIEEGWSEDLKFHLKQNNGESRLLRLSKLEQFKEKKDHFNSLKPVQSLDLPISKALEFGKCRYNGYEYCYTLFSWVHGELLNLSISTLSKERQYKLGYCAGQILKELHELPIQETYKTLDWEKSFNKKLDRNIKMAEDCSVKYDGQANIIDYIRSTRHFLKDRPISFHHGDYHIGNMLIHEGELGVIDFNRLDHGDPWEEFNRITWCASSSSEFARGRVNGYFSDRVPEGFFDLLALYIASNLLSSVPWSTHFGQEQIDVALKEIKAVLLSFEFFSKCTPSWYKSSS